MFATTNVTTRDLLRNYKRVIDRVKETKEPAVVVSQKEPQVAIVCLSDLEALRDLRYRDSGRVLRKTAHRVRAVLKDENLPADLSLHHNTYLWEDEGDIHPHDI